MTLRRAVEPLILALKDEDISVRCSAAEALGRLGDARAVEPLVKALGDKDAKVRIAAAEALGKLGDARAIEPLIKALRADKAQALRAQADLGREISGLVLRRNAAEALGKLALRHPDWIGKRWQEVHSLITLKHIDAFEHSKDASEYSSIPHDDVGIGLDFPSKPPGLDF